MDSKELKSISEIKAYFVICESVSSKIKNRNRNIIILFDFNGKKFRSDFPFLERSFPSREMVLRSYFVNDGLIYETSLKPVSFEQITLTEEQNALYLNKIKQVFRKKRHEEICKIRNEIRETKQKEAEQRKIKKSLGIAKMRKNRISKTIGSNSWNRLNKKLKEKIKKHCKKNN